MRIKSTKSNAIIFLTLLSAAVCALVPAVSASDPASGDWPMWGGGCGHNGKPLHEGRPAMEARSCPTPEDVRNGDVDDLESAPVTDF